MSSLAPDLPKKSGECSTPNDLRRWHFHPDGELILNADSDATAGNGLIRPCLHNRGCGSLQAKHGNAPSPLLVDGPSVSMRAAYALWGHERGAQPLRRVWFCETCLMRRVA